MTLYFEKNDYIPAFPIDDHSYFPFICSGRIVRTMLNFGSLRSFPLFVVYVVVCVGARYITRLVGPFQLRIPLIFHNFACCGLSIASAAIGFYGLLTSDSILVIADGNEYIKHALHIYWIGKILELCDTLFMILRHKMRQISFLHVFHHSSMLLLADYACNLAPWPPVALGIVLNSMVHIVMYGYYALTALYPLRDFAWKRLITQLQMVQFLVGVVMGVNGYLSHGYCVYSILFPAAMFGLFSNYYYHAYVMRKEPKDVGKSKES